MANDKATLRGLHEALDGLPNGHPMRRAIQAGIDHLTGEPEPPPPDVIRDCRYNKPIVFTAKVTSGGLPLTDNFKRNPF